LLAENCFERKILDVFCCKLKIVLERQILDAVCVDILFYTCLGKIVLEKHT
jgi:hypothetical protein